MANQNPKGMSDAAAQTLLRHNLCLGCLFNMGPDWECTYCGYDNRAVAERFYKLQPKTTAVKSGQ